MKKIGVLATIAVMMVALMMVFYKAEPSIRYTPGTYEGVGKGQHGEIHVAVTTDAYNILSVDIIEEFEMPEISKAVYTSIADEVIKRNSVNVATVSGASFTSRGVLEAIENALEKAMIEGDAQ